MKKFFFLCAIVFLFTGAKISAQDDMFKALFMYNFTKYIEWPSSYKSGDFVIAVIGQTGMTPELKKIAQKKKVVNQPIIVQVHNSVSSVGKCHMLYIPSGNSTQLGTAVSKLGSSPTAIVTDNPGLAAQGAGINYVKIDGKQKFEINTGTLRACGLRVNSNLVNLGIEVR
jgi:hypothetical protein